ncbi:MAG: riboflavin kinase [Cyphobasidiales sp. Tagirdzhanova-0007]|nr:MAG: riboflavin kinase [Cyphobasidiales sp. Tagirdzhanova-0007]
MGSAAPAPLQHDPRSQRPSICGPDEVQQPYPIYMKGAVQHGFKRGSKDLGCPTANLPDEAIAPSASMLETGVHFGYARVLMGSEQDREEERAQQALPMVMSIGWNPYYRNEKRTAEVHILHIFKHDFYGCELRIVMLGYIRPEYNYTSVETLIQDIETDKAVTLTSLERPAYEKYLKDPFFT